MKSVRGIIQLSQGIVQGRVAQNGFAPVRQQKPYSMDILPTG